MENYIVINGRKAELTEEQLEKLGIEVKDKNPFERVEVGNTYYAINGLVPLTEENVRVDNDQFEAGNYFNDKEFAKQVYLHTLLDIKLLKFAYDHKSNVDWKNESPKYYIIHNESVGKFDVVLTINHKSFNVCFVSHFLATKATTNVVKPFMKEHPDFVW